MSGKKSQPPHKGFNLPSAAKPKGETPQVLHTLGDLASHQDKFAADSPSPDPRDEALAEFVTDPAEFRRLYGEEQKIGKTLARKDKISQPTEDLDTIAPVPQRETAEETTARRFHEDFDIAYRSAIAEAVRLTPFIDAELNRIYETDTERYSHLKSEKQRAIRREWILTMLVKLEAGSRDTLEYPDDPENLRAQRRERQAQLLSRMVATMNLEQWTIAAEADAAYVYRTYENKPSIPESLHTGQLVGNVFEQFSRVTPIQDEGLVNYQVDGRTAREGQRSRQMGEEVLDSQEHILRKIQEKGQIVEFNKFKDRDNQNVRRDGVVSELTINRVLETRIPEWERAKQLGREKHIFIVLDSPLREAKVRNPNTLVVRYAETGIDDQGRRSFQWIAEPDEVIKRMGQARFKEDFEPLLARMNEMSEHYAARVSIPDHAVVNPERSQEIVGIVEDKNMTAAELQLYVEALKRQSQQVIESGTRLDPSAGIFISAEELNQRNQELGLDEQTYQEVVRSGESLGAGLYLDLDFEGESYYAAAINGQVEANFAFQSKAMARILRIPDGPNLTDQLITELQTELLKRGQRVWVQKFNCLNRDETELIGRDYMHSLDFVEELQNRYNRNRAVQSNPYLRMRNIQARAFALGISDLKQFFSSAEGGFQAGQQLFEIDIVDDIAQGLTGAIEQCTDQDGNLEPIDAWLEQTFPEGKPMKISSRRKVLIDQLKADYLATQLEEDRPVEQPLPETNTHVPAAEVEEEPEITIQEPPAWQVQRGIERRREVENLREHLAITAENIEGLFSVFKFIALTIDETSIDTFDDAIEFENFMQGRVVTTPVVRAQLDVPNKTMRLEVRDITKTPSVLEAIEQLRGVKIGDWKYNVEFSVG